MTELRERVAMAICKSRKFECGQGCCAPICMDQLGDARVVCPHVTDVHGDLTDIVLAAMPERWRSIDSAPKDGTFVLVAGDSGYVTTPLRVEVCKYDAEYRPLNPWVNHAGDAFTDGGAPAKYWMPFPAPPSAGEEDRQA